MAMAILGETIDIHAGAVDLIFPHHEDEIAQSEAATGKPFARCWCHGEFLLTDGTKMAKRVGNVQNVADLRANGVSGAAVRHFVFSTHYRKQLNLSAEALEGSIEAVRRVRDFADRLAAATAGTPALEAAADALEEQVRSALADDLDAPAAVAALFDFIRTSNRELDLGGRDARALARAREAFALVDGILDLVPEPVTAEAEFAAWVEAQLVARAEARARRDFGTADAIRREIEGRGVVLEDGAGGTRWKLAR
jgi:cysteinyl-tRNA synthetase